MWYNGWTLIVNRQKYMAKVTMYSTPTCSYCRAAKDFFKEKGVEYEDFDVSTDSEKREEMVKKSGQMSVPVIIVDDEMMVGFDQEKLSSLLKLS